MKKGNKKKTGLVAILLILVLLISVGYATISTNLNIGGNATITAQNWLVYFTNIETTAGSVTPTTAPTTSGTSTTTLTWAVSLDTPGQFYEYTVDVKNDGSIDAMIGTLSNSTLTTAQAKYLNYTVTYSDGAEIEQYDKLDAGTTEKLRVRVEFKSDPEELPATASAITLNYASNYVQADTTHAKARNTVTPPVSLTTGDTVTYVTSLNNVTLDNWKVFYTEGDYVYLIYGDYLPKTAIDTTNITGLTTDETYGIAGSGTRSAFINALTTKSNWSSLLTGTLNGTKQISETTSENVWAMGSPTVELFRDSWNATFPSKMLYIEKTETMSDGLKGYYIGTSPNPNEDLVSIPDYTSTLYFPYDYVKDNCLGYWIASPGAGDVSKGFVVERYQGFFGAWGYTDTMYTLRPVIRLPLSDFN